MFVSAFVIIRCGLKVFALFLERNSVPLTDRCWFEYGLLRRRPPGCFFGSRCSSLFSVCLGCSCVSCSFWFYFSNIIWFLRFSICLSLSFSVCFVVEGTLVGDFPRRCCVWAGHSNSSLFKRICGSSWMFVFACFSQMLNFWISDVGVSLNGIRNYLQIRQATNS